MLQDLQNGARADSRPTHRWMGQSGQWYEFVVQAPDAVLDLADGVYLLVRLRPDGLYDVLYLGRTGQEGERLSRRERLEAARRFGLTHAHLLVEDSASRRLELEADLLRLHRPPLNEQAVLVQGAGQAPGQAPGPFQGAPDVFSAPSVVIAPAPIASQAPLASPTQIVVGVTGAPAYYPAPQPQPQPIPGWNALAAVTALTAPSQPVGQQTQYFIVVRGR